jgi:hypothetical protein
MKPISLLVSAALRITAEPQARFPSALDGATAPSQSGELA